MSGEHVVVGACHHCIQLLKGKAGGVGGGPCGAVLTEGGGTERAVDGADPSPGLGGPHLAEDSEAEGAELSARGAAPLSVLPLLLGRGAAEDCGRVRRGGAEVGGEEWADHSGVNSHHGGHEVPRREDRVDCAAGVAGGLE